VLADGQIEATGVLTSTARGPCTFTLAIVGGTGRYAAATGYAVVCSGGLRTSGATISMPSTDSGKAWACHPVSPWEAASCRM